MAGLSDLKDALPDIGGLLKNFDVSSLVGSLPDIGELISSLPDLSNVLGPFDPIEIMSRIDLSGIVSSLGEQALGMLGNLPMVRGAS